MFTKDKCVEQEQVRFSNFILKGGMKRVEKNIIAGRAIKPCGKECEEYGYKLVEYFNHSSLQNFENLMNNIDFLLKCAKISPNPMQCEEYFYLFVNENLKKNKHFRIEFLKSIYLNDNVYTPESIMWFVDTFGFSRENEIILADLEFKKKFAARLNEHFDYPKFTLDGNNSKKLRAYKNECNAIKIKNGLRDEGIAMIYEMFAKDKLEESEGYKDFGLDDMFVNEMSNFD